MAHQGLGDQEDEEWLRKSLLHTESETNLCKSFHLQEVPESFEESGATITTMELAVEDREEQTTCVDGTVTTWWLTCNPEEMTEPDDQGGSSLLWTGNVTWSQDYPEGADKRKPDEAGFVGCFHSVGEC